MARNHLTNGKKSSHEWQENISRMARNHLTKDKVTASNNIRDYLK